jgi:pimeloyl-ACP methyl ester carboxylesterase
LTPALRPKKVNQLAHHVDPLRSTLKVAFLATLAASCLLSCAVLKKPDMTRTAGIAQLRKPQHPLIIIPGFLGSKLRDPKTGKVLWGTMGNVLSHDSSYRLACPIGTNEGGVAQEDLEAFAIYDSLWGVEYYRKVLRILSQAGGYQMGDIQNPKPGDNAFVFVYDWRKDIVDSAIRLSEAIENLKLSMGTPDVKFDLLAHSQGGLVARYYAKYGSQDVLEQEFPPLPNGSGARNLNKVILLGTPNQGTLEALRILHHGLKKVFRPMPPAVTFTMPALYEMLPPAGIPSFADLNGNPVTLDLYDPETWIENKLSVFADGGRELFRREIRATGSDAESGEASDSQIREFLARTLKRAQRFQEALAAPAPGAQDVAFHAFGSDCIPTLKTAVVLEEKGERAIYFDPGSHRRDAVGDRIDKILYGPGDGTVLMESLLNLPEIYGGAPPQSVGERINLASAFFICESHGLLPNDPIFQNNLFYLLLYESDPLSLPRPSVAEVTGS